MEDVGRLPSKESRVQKLPLSGFEHVRVKPFKPRTERQAQYKELLAGNDLTFLLGPAGTGKTLLAAAQAIEDLASGRARKIFITRPAREPEDEKLGYLAGPLDEKMEPRVRPIVAAFERFLDVEAVDDLLGAGIIEIVALAFISGYTFEHATVIYDEMQNTTPHMGMLALTRAGRECRLIVTADPAQSLLPAHLDSFAGDLDRFRGRPGIAFAEFGLADCVRSKLVKQILSAYQNPC